MNKLEKYIENWKGLPYPKPKNEPELIDLFLEFLKTDISKHDVSFDGDGSYGGTQISINSDHVFLNHNFEVVYSKVLIAVYDGNNNGCWTPEYIDMDINHERFTELKNALKTFLTKAFAIDVLSEKTFTVKEIKNYLLKQDSLGDVIYNLTEENIIKAQELSEQSSTL